MKMYFYNHSYHIVTYSPWPLMISFNLLILMVGSIKMFNYIKYFLLMFGFYSIILILMQWWQDIIRKSTLQGLHIMKIILY